MMSFNLLEIRGCI